MLLPFHTGVTEALLFAGMALVGRGDAARTLFRDVELWLPDVGKRNTSGAWAVLKLSVPGLMLGDDLVRCGALYPSCISYVSTGVTNHWSIAPGNPQTVAGIAAHAAGLRDRAHDHCENRDPPGRHAPAPTTPADRALLVRPSAGRRSAPPAEQARGRAMIAAAATDFRSLEMVTYANLAEQYLRR